MGYSTNCFLANSFSQVKRGHLFPPPNTHFLSGFSFLFFSFLFCLFYLLSHTKRNPVFLGDFFTGFIVSHSQLGGEVKKLVLGPLCLLIAVLKVKLVSSIHLYHTLLITLHLAISFRIHFYLPRCFIIWLTFFLTTLYCSSLKFKQDFLLREMQYN